MSVPPDQLRAQLLAAALKARNPEAALDPTATSSPSLDGAAQTFSQGLALGKTEQAGALFRNPDGSFSYSIPVTQQLPEAVDYRVPVQKGYQLAGIFHTHPSTDQNAQVFSTDDVRLARQLNLPSYVLFQKDGSIRKFIPGQTSVQHNGGRLNETISKGDPLTQLAQALKDAKSSTDQNINQVHP